MTTSEARQINQLRQQLDEERLARRQAEQRLAVTTRIGTLELVIVRWGIRNGEIDNARCNFLEPNR
jgi:hypothetical protein